MIKATGPCPTALMSFLLMGTTYTMPTIAATVALVLGTILAIPMGGSDHTSLRGVALVVLSTLAMAVRPVVMKQVFEGSVKRPKLAPTVLLFYDSCITSVFMVSAPDPVCDT